MEAQGNDDTENMKLEAARSAFIKALDADKDSPWHGPTDERGIDLTTYSIDGSFDLTIALHAAIKAYRGQGK